jgi:hypothetical protein
LLFFSAWICEPPRAVAGGPAVSTQGVSRQIEVAFFQPVGIWPLEAINLLNQIKEEMNQS